MAPLIAREVLVTNSDRGPQLNLAAWISVVFMCLGVLTRLGSKYIIIRRLAWDDALVTVAMVSNLSILVESQGPRRSRYQSSSSRADRRRRSLSRSKEGWALICRPSAVHKETRIRRCANGREYARSSLIFPSGWICFSATLHPSSDGREIVHPDIPHPTYAAEGVPQIHPACHLDRVGLGLRRLHRHSVSVRGASDLGLSLAVLHGSGLLHRPLSSPWLTIAQTALWDFLGALDIVTEILTVAFPIFIVSNLQISSSRKMTVFGAFASRVL